MKHMTELKEEKSSSRRNLYIGFSLLGGSILLGILYLLFIKEGQRPGLGYIESQLR
jgi:hypothetical protein